MEAVDPKKTKDRSPGFPFISLARSLERARQFYQEERRGAAPFGRTVMHWKYSESSSGALQTVAALKQYGLMEDVGGSGKARQLKLTELALRILLDQRPDSPERDMYIKQAALAPAVASEVFERWPELPSDTTLSHFLILELKFNESSAASAVRILKENQLLAKITAKDLESADQESTQEAKDPSQNMNAPALRLDTRPGPPASVGATAYTSSVQLAVAAAAAVNQRVLAHDGVGITIQFVGEPTKETFDYLARYCNFEKENVPAKVQPQRERVKLLNDDPADTETN